MDELTSKRALLEKIADLFPYCGHCDGYGFVQLDCVEDAVKETPVVDAVEVKDLQKQLLKEGTLLYGGNEEFEKRMCGYNPSSFVAGFNYALQRMSGWVTSLDGERKENETN